MKRLSAIIVLAAVFAFAGAGLLLGFRGQAEAAAGQSKLEQQVLALQTQVESLQTEANSLREANHNVEVAAAEHQRLLDGLLNRVGQLNSELKASEAMLSELKVKVAAAKAPELKAADAALAEAKVSAPKVTESKAVVPEASEVKFTLAPNILGFQGMDDNLKGRDPRIEVHQGDLVRITLINTDVEHDFVVDGVAQSPHLKKGDTATVTFIADKAGEYTYYCSLPGHRQVGMEGTLVVVASTPGALVGPQVSAVP